MNQKIIEETAALVESVKVKTISMKGFLKESNGRDAGLAAKTIEEFTEEISGLIFKIKHKKKYLSALAKSGLSHEDLVKKRTNTIIYKVVDCNSSGALIILPTNRKAKRMTVSNPKSLIKISL